MFRNRQTRRQLVFVGMTMIMVFVLGQLFGNSPEIDINEWEIFKFSDANLPADIDFTIEQQPQHIDAILTNTHETISQSVLTDFMLVKLTCEERGEWRIFPFQDNFQFAENADTIGRSLPPGESFVFSLTEEMLAAPLLSGHYRIVVLLNPTSASRSRTVWAAFDLHERE